MVRTGNWTSGSSETGSLPSDTAPSSTSASTAAMVVTGRLRAVAAIDIRSWPLYGVPRSWRATMRTGASCVSVRWPSISTVSPAATGI